jgi:signal transduction histidine kinase
MSSTPSVIAVELHLPPGDRAQLETLTGVLGRAVDVMITQNERRSLARELHDEIGQSLSAILMETEGAECTAQTAVVLPNGRQ